MSNFKKCKQDIVEETLDEYFYDEKKVSSKKQALAIGLNKAQDECKYSKSDYAELELKVNKFLYDDDRKIAQKRIPLTNVIETVELYKYYLKKNKRKANKIRDDLIKRISDAGRKGISVNKNIFKEIYNIY